MLARAARDGLPKRAQVKTIPRSRAYSGEFCAEYIHNWKSATQRSNRGPTERELIPFFGARPVNVRHTALSG